MSQKSTEVVESSTTEVEEYYPCPFNGEMYVHFQGEGDISEISKTYDDLLKVLIEELNLTLGSCRLQIYQRGK